MPPGSFRIGLGRPPHASDRAPALPCGLIPSRRSDDDDARGYRRLRGPGAGRPRRRGQRAAGADRRGARPLPHATRDRTGDSRGGGDRRRLRPRYVREWLAAQAASGYVTHAAGKFSLSPAQSLVFAEADSPVYLVGAFETAAAMVENQARVQAAFHTGKGVAWGDQAGCLFCAVARMFRPGYVNALVRNGCRRSTGWWSGSPQAHGSRTSAAATGSRRS